MSKVQTKSEIRKKEIKKVLWITLYLNIFVALIKIIVGNLSGYLSLTSSGLESMFDGASNVLGLISITLAFQPADKDHNYGHFKYENIGGILLAILLFYSSIQIAVETIKIFDGVRPSAQFGALPIVSILVSLSMSIFVSYYEGKKGRELNSKILISDSKHTLGDSIISFAVLASIILSYWKIFWADILVGGIVSFYLIYLAIQVFRENLPELLDESAVIDPDLLKKIEAVSGVIDVHNFRSRGNENYVFIDCHLHLLRTLSLVEAHTIGKQVEEVIRTQLGETHDRMDITIHYEPFDHSHKDYSK